MKLSIEYIILIVVIMATIATASYYYFAPKKAEPEKKQVVCDEKPAYSAMDTISKVEAVTENAKPHVFIGEKAAQYLAEKQFEPKIYTNVFYDASTDHYIVNVLVAMTHHQSKLIEQYLADKSLYVEFPGPKFLRTAMDRSADVVLREKKRLLVEAQQFIDRQKSVPDSIEYIKNN